MALDIDISVLRVCSTGLFFYVGVLLLTFKKRVNIYLPLTVFAWGIAGAFAVVSMTETVELMRIPAASFLFLGGIFLLILCKQTKRKLK